SQRDDAGDGARSSRVDPAAGECGRCFLREMRARHHFKQGTLPGIGRALHGDGDQSCADHWLRSRGRDRKRKRENRQDSAGNLPREKSAAGSRTQSRARSGRDDRAGWQRLSWWMKLSMPKKIIVLAVVLARMTSAMLAAENHIDVAAIINKADAESVLGVKVKEPMPGNFQGGDGYYSKCNYYSVTPGKTLLLRTYQAAAGYDAQKELEMVTKNTTSVKPVSGLGDKALATSGTASGLPARVMILYVVKGNALVTVGLSGLEDDAAALDKAKTVAQKLLVHL